MKPEQEGPPAYMVLGVEEQEIVDFLKESRVWQAIMNELILRQELIVNALLDPTPGGSNMYGTDDTKRGRHNEIDFVLQLPQSMLVDIRLSNKENKEKKDARSNGTNGSTGDEGRSI
jgi:hypothetical protein